jgi:hypothetical protein
MGLDTTRGDLQQRGYWFTADGFAVPPNWVQFLDGANIPVYREEASNFFVPTEPEPVRHALRHLDVNSADRDS